MRLNRGKPNLIFAAVLFLALIFGRIEAIGAAFKASLDRDTITLGETATLSLTFEDGQPRTEPVPDVPGLQFIRTGNQSSFTVVNGAMSSVLTITFAVTPANTGEFTIPSLKVDVGGQSLESEALKLTVTKPEAPSAAAVESGSQLAFMKLALPKEKLYVGETVVARVSIFLRDDVVDHSKPQFTSMPWDGFSIGKGAYETAVGTRVGNRRYAVYPVSIAVTATKAGTVSLGPFTASVAIALADPNQANDPFSQLGVRSPYYHGEQKQLSLATEAVSAEAVPLPDQDKPATFNGAIGSYTMTVTAGPTNVTVGDPITVRVQIAGSGVPDDIKLPDQSWTGFKAFPPTQKTEGTDALGLNGRKIFEEIVTPQNADIHELPPFVFSFFNPADGKYHTLSRPAVPLVVAAAGLAPMPSLAGGKNPPAEKQTQDIVSVRQSMGTPARPGRPLVASPVFVSMQVLPVLAFIGAVVWRRRAENLANNPRLRRRLQVQKTVEAGLADLKRFAAANDPDQFFATLFRLLQEQLGERLDRPAASVTEAAVEDDLVIHGAPAGLPAELRELFQLCNQARYAPVRGTSELNSVAVRFEKVSRELMEVKA